MRKSWGFLQISLHPDFVCWLLITRSWRFGQKNPVTIDMITTKGQENVLKNLEEKSRKSMAMFDSMVNEINNSLIVKNEFSTTRTEVPSWL